MIRNPHPRFLQSLPFPRSSSPPADLTCILRPYILNTPNLVSLSTTLPPNAASNPIPNTLLVWLGGMTPSSHSRAVPNKTSLSLSIRLFSPSSTFLPTAFITASSCSAPNSSQQSPAPKCPSSRCSSAAQPGQATMGCADAPTLRDFFGVGRRRGRVLWARSSWML